MSNIPSFVVDSTHHPDLLSLDKKRRKLAGKSWTVSFQRLWKVLHYRAAEAVGQDQASVLLRTGSIFTFHFR